MIQENIFKFYKVKNRPQTAMQVSQKRTPLLDESNVFLQNLIFPRTLSAQNPMLTIHYDGARKFDFSLEDGLCTDLDEDTENFRYQIEPRQTRMIIHYFDPTHKNLIGLEFFNDQNDKICVVGQCL